MRKIEKQRINEKINSGLNPHIFHYILASNQFTETGLLIKGE